MAAFVFKRNGFAASPNRGFKSTMSDNDMKKLFDAYRVSFGKVTVPGDPEAVPPVPPTVRDMTDDEVTDRIITDVLQGVVTHGDATAKMTVAKTAAAAVAPISAVVTPDNT